MSANLTDRTDFDRAALEWLADRVAAEDPILEASELGAHGLPSADTEERVRAWSELGVRFAKRPADGVVCCRADDVLAAIAQLANPGSLVVVGPPALVHRGSDARN